MLATGVRVGEALALYKSDVDFTVRAVSITKDVVFIGGQRIEQPPKTEAAFRTLPLSEELCRELQELPEGLLFPYNYNSVRLAIQKIEKHLEFKVTAHVLRHTYSDSSKKRVSRQKLNSILWDTRSLTPRKTSTPRRKSTMWKPIQRLSDGYLTLNNARF